MHEEGDTENLRDYTPFSLLLIVYKISTKIINNRLQRTFDAGQLREQAGFRSDCSKIEHI